MHKYVYMTTYMLTVLLESLTLALTVLLESFNFMKFYGLFRSISSVD